MALFPSVLSQLPGRRLITLDQFHHGRGSILFFLEQIRSLDTDLLSWHTMLLSELPSYLQDTVFTIMVVYTALLLIKELTSQQKKCGNVPVLMEFTGLTCSPLS